MHVKARGAAALLTVPVLLFAAGCAGEHAGTQDAGEGKSSGQPASGASAAAAGTPLERAALAPGDLDGYQISTGAKDPRATKGQPQADRKACQPLADIMGDEPDLKARETVSRGAGSRTVLGLAVSASLSSYAEADARGLLEGLRTALDTCKQGYSATVEKQTGSYKDVRATAYEVGGDESVSWTTTAVAGGVSAPVHLLVVREGATVVRMMALNVAGKGAAEVPHDLADKQLEKLDRVLGG
ncbi:hypothetical protein LG634_27955 [Streptomyces bambusae]|uniref:hypothetical protein n=1 Tax=Streptomyces bambusae TaxID=1550616 RepID=UPI001CFEF5E7|nr:hypothetical protein [Streptomyces bambusae]MCB5168642.1 hypothetical protein [Streptomyces bambusae]